MEIVMRFLRCLTYFFGMALLASPAYGQPAAGIEIEFEVTDTLSEPLAYATVELKARGSGKIHAATTDFTGKCTFALPAGLA